MQIQTGTVQVTNGNARVIASAGNNWQAASIGSLFAVSGEGVLYQIAGLSAPGVSDSHQWELMLAAPYSGPTAAAVPYAIHVDFTPNRHLPILRPGDSNTAALFTLLSMRLDMALSDQGEKGDKGDQGDPGAQGIPGQTGPQGVSITSVETGPELSTIRVFLSNDTHSDVTVPTVQGDVGPQGPAGADGAQGIPGPGITNIQDLGTGTARIYYASTYTDVAIPGITGPQGAPGSNGADGATGAQGVQGEKGDKGDKGDTGEKGDKGDPGDAGSGGGGLIDDNVAYISMAGNDSTGDGSPGNPYLTAQKAIDSGKYFLRLGVGSFGDVNIVSITFRTLVVVGMGMDVSQLGTVHLPSGVEDQMTVQSTRSVTIDQIIVDAYGGTAGASGPSAGLSGEQGQNAQNISLKVRDAVLNGITLNGGQGGAGGNGADGANDPNTPSGGTGAYGGNGSAIQVYMENCLVNGTAIFYGGAGGAGGAGANGGMYSDGDNNNYGAGGDGGHGGYGGSISYEMHFCRFQSGLYPYPGGAGAGGTFGSSGNGQSATPGQPGDSGSTTANFSVLVLGNVAYTNSSGV